MAIRNMHSQDPVVLAAQAREVLKNIHKRTDTVVKLKTNSSDHKEDLLDELDKRAPGHFRADQKVLTLNLDTLIPGNRPIPSSLASIEDWRKYPVLAGVAAHEAAHARFSLWESDGNEIPKQIPNPDYDPEAEVSETNPEFFPVDLKRGKLYDLVKILEEPRVERLGVKHFSKTWRKAMQYSATHLIMEQADEDQVDGVSNLDTAVRTMILVGGRNTAGTLGVSFKSRQAVKRVLAAAQRVVEESLQGRINAEPGFDPYYEIMGLINDAVFLEDHTDATAQLEIARQILKITHPEEANDPDQAGGGSGGGEGEGDSGEGEGKGKGDSGEGEGSGGGSGEAPDPGLTEALDGLAEQMQEEVRVVEEQPESKLQEESGGHGSVIYKNPKAPQLEKYEKPGARDRARYHKALDWMMEQASPTVTESEQGGWLPVGGARLNVRSYVRDNLAGHMASQRADWDRVSETIEPAPPVKVAIMLDGSGSMASYRHESASIAWAMANAAAQLPESRTVSVVFGAAAQVTQQPGHEPVKNLAISRTDGPWENFGEAVELVEEALWLDEDANNTDPHDPDGGARPNNTLIVIVSDLVFGGSAPFRGSKGDVRQSQVFNTVTQEWAERGYTVAVIGTERSGIYHELYGINTEHVKLVKSVDDLIDSTGAGS